MPTFTFTPGLLHDAQVWTIQGGRLVGPAVEVELAEVTDCSFDYTLHKGRSLANLKLSTPDGTTTLSCNARLDSADRRQYLLLASEVMRGLREHHPDLLVRSPGMDIQAWAFAGLGGSMTLYGLYFAGSDWLRRGLGFGTWMGLFFVLLGLFMVWAGSPWTANQPKTTTEALDWLGRLL